MTIDSCASQMRIDFLGVRLAEIHHDGVVYVARGNIEFVGYAAPEPASGVLAAPGLGGLAAFGFRRR